MRFPPLDALSRLTLEVHNLLVGLSPEMGTPPYAFVFRVMRIRVPSDTAREVTERLALLHQVQREHAEGQARKRKEAMNGH